MILELQRAAILDGVQEMVRRYCREPSIYPETRHRIMTDPDPAGFAESLAASLNVGPLRRNGATCLLCRDQIVSANRHDFQTCLCGNVSVDGGTWYARRVCRAGNFEDDVETWPWIVVEDPC